MASDIYATSEHEAFRAQVAVKRVGLFGKVGDEEGKPPLVEVIAEIYAHRPLLKAVSTQRRAAEHRDIFKRAVVLVAVEIIRARVIGHVKIQPAVVVVVSPDHSQAVIAG